MVNVQTVNLPPDGVNAPALAWHNGDFGIVMRPNGYYVFKIVDDALAVGDTSFTVRATAAYFSGLLDIPAGSLHHVSGL